MFRTALVSSLALGCILVVSAPAAEKAPAAGASSSSATRAKKSTKKSSTPSKTKPASVSRIVPAEPVPVAPPPPVGPVESAPPPPPPVPEEPRLVFPREVVIRETYSLPVLWDGREVGRRLFSPGQKITATRMNGESVECSVNGQTFQLPSRVLDLRPELAQPTAAAAVAAPATETAAAPPPAAAGITSLPEPVVEVPISQGEPAPLFAPAALVTVRAYLAEVERFVRETAPTYRFIQYAQLRRCQPAPLRKIVKVHAGESGGETAERQAMEKLRTAVVQYDFGRWTDFEASVAAAARLLAGPDATGQ